MLSDVVFYAWAYWSGLGVLSIMGAAVMMYALVFNSFIQLVVSGDFWGRGPDEFKIPLLGWKVQRRLLNRKLWTVVGFAILVLDLTLAPR